VAQYLGLGSADEPSHLEKYAPLPDGPRSSLLKPARKRQKLRGSEDATIPTRARSATKASTQRRVSETLRVTKARSKSAYQSKTSAFEVSRSDAASATDVQARTDGSQPSRPTLHDSPPLAHNVAMKRSTPSTVVTQQDTFNTSAEYYADTQPFDHGTNDYDTEVTEKSDCAQAQAASSIFDDEDFDDNMNDDEFLELTSDMIGTGGSTRNFSSSPTKHGVEQPTNDTDDIPGSSAKSPIAVGDESSVKQTTKKFVTPTTLTTRLLAATGDVENAAAKKPIARPPFPVAVRDRSPIIGLSSNTLLRTCFRIGEVINQAHQASKSGQHIVFELYARVLDSERDDTNQHFTFCDLFHGKPPYLNAVYDAKLWKSVQLFTYDSKRLLQQGRIGRCMGTMKREGKEWIMTVLNVWEATWEDIKWVEGIVNS
jgi:hypothetical protein